MGKSVKKSQNTTTVSDLRKENALLKQRLEIFENIIVLTPGHVYWKDRNSVYLGCNDEMARVVGLKSRHDIVGKTDYDLPWKEKAHILIKNDKEVMDTGMPQAFEESGKLADRSETIFYTNKTPIRDKNNKIIGLLGISLNITKRKKIEAKLEKANKQLEKTQQDKIKFLAHVVQEITGQKIRSNKPLNEYITTIRDYFENIIALTPGHVYWKDRNSMYLGCNDEMARVVGLKSRHDIVGKTDYDLPWREKAHILIKNDKEVIDTGIPQAFEESGQRANGSLLFGYTNKTPLRDKNGKVIGILGISLDITDRKKMEEQLKEAKKRAEIANNIKTEFIRNMQHDIRTPLSGVFGMTNLLKSKEKDSEKKEYINDLLTCSKELLDYFDDIIDFSKIEENNLPIISKKFDFKKLIKKVIHLETPAAKIKNLQLCYECDNSIPNNLLGDDFRIYRILVNLISNSIKFTKTGFVKVSAKMVKKILTKKTVIISMTVEDSGIGIPEDKLNYIYEKFSRIHPSNQNRYKGLGLGLRIVKQFIVDLEGNIDVQSILGKGTKFSCILPLTIPLDDALVNPTTSEDKKNE